MVIIPYYKKGQVDVCEDRDTAWSLSLVNIAVNVELRNVTRIAQRL